MYCSFYVNQFENFEDLVWETLNINTFIRFVIILIPISKLVVQYENQNQHNYVYGMRLQPICIP